jgi:hypothetical protein
VDASSAAILKQSSTNTISVQGPGLIFTNNQLIVGTADLRRQVRSRILVHAFTRDGIEVRTNVTTIFTLSEAPKILLVAYDGAPILANLKVINLITDGLIQNVEFVDELELDDKVEIHNFILAYSGLPGPYILDADNPLPPYAVDENRIFAAVSSGAQDVADEKILDWTELPVYAAVEVFRNILSQELYDNLYLPTEPEAYPLNNMKSFFSKKVRNLGILSYQFVKPSVGNTLVPGQVWNPAVLTFYPVQNLIGSKVLRNRGIKVISAGFSDLEPTSDKVKERLMERWSASWEQEATIITADHELQAMRIRNLARAEAQGEMVAALALILNAPATSEDALAVQVFQALETAAADPKTRQLLPAETIAMLNNLRNWLM